MLRIIKQIEPSAFAVQYDEYIPFTIEFENDSLAPPVYWRVGNGKSSLIEVGLNKHSGQMLSVVLTSIATENVIKNRGDYSPIVKEEIGMPIFDLSYWKNGVATDHFSNQFVDEFNLAIELTLGKNSLNIAFFDGLKPVRLIRNGNIIFGVDSAGFLISIALVNLTKTDVEVINSTV